ncbi:hypothetical protein CDAR_577411 [Caerostris darwini]|uniref:Uncharacterized protein n=1 Tax=Caerostris darwini TaxID=1538125 RepID=A0AAV4U3S1_9ARAC|nr:hypothetical protein CDAR_577411 [Caerostris darwini]
MQFSYKPQWTYFTGGSPAISNTAFDTSSPTSPRITVVFLNFQFHRMQLWKKMTRNHDFWNNGKTKLSLLPSRKQESKISNSCFLLQIIPVMISLQQRTLTSHPRRSEKAPPFLLYPVLVFPGSQSFSETLGLPRPNG